MKMQITQIAIRMQHLVASNQRSIVRAMWEAMVVIGGLVTTRLFAFLVSVLVARSTGASTFGEYTLFTTIFTLASEIPNAFDTTFIRFANSPEGKGREDEYLVMDLFAVLANALIIGLSGWLAAPFVAQLLFDKPGAADIIRYGTLSGTVFCIFTSLAASYQQKRKFVQVSLFRPLFNLILLISVGGTMILGVAITQKDLSRIYLVISISLSLLALAKFRSVIKRNATVIKKHAKPFFGVGLLIMLSAAINQLSGRLDVFFLTSFLDYHELGMYGAAVRISIFVSLFTAMLTTVMLPRASLARLDPTAFKRYFGLAGMYILGQSVVALLLIAWMGNIIGFVFGAAYLSAVFAASLLVLQALCTSCVIPFQALIQCGSRPGLILWVNVGKMLASLMLLPRLIPSYGVNGAAAAVAIIAFIVMILTAAIALHICRRDLQR